MADIPAPPGIPETPAQPPKTEEPKAPPAKPAKKRQARVAKPQSDVVIVTPVHPYRIYCQSQAKWIMPGSRTELIRDSWVEGQLKFKGLKEV